MKVLNDRWNNVKDPESKGSCPFCKCDDFSLIESSGDLALISNIQKFEFKKLRTTILQCENCGYLAFFGEKRR